MCPHTTILCVPILLYMCPHATLYMSSYYYICVLMLLYTCPHTTIYIPVMTWQSIPIASSTILGGCCAAICVLILCMSSSSLLKNKNKKKAIWEIWRRCCYICVLIRYMSLYYYICVLYAGDDVAINPDRLQKDVVVYIHTSMCPHTNAMCVLILLHICRRWRGDADIYVSWYICVLIRYMSLYYYICGHICRRWRGNRCSSMRTHTTLCVSSYYYILLHTTTYMQEMMRQSM